MDGFKLASLLIILATLLGGIGLHPQLPEQVAVHWNSAGQADGYMTGWVAVIFLPLLSLVLFGVFFYAPLFDPLKRNYPAFRNELHRFALLIVGFLAYLQGIVLAFNLDWLVVSVSRLVVPAVGVLLIGLGRLLKHVRQNWFFGVRTPWTLESEGVWDKTNRLAGKLFKASGVILLLSAFLRRYHVTLVIITVALTAVYACIYSYLMYRREQNDAEDPFDRIDV